MNPTARIYRGTPTNLARLAACLRRGELVAVPTETVYGLAADATDAAACRRIFTAKGRPASDPLIVHIARLRDLAAVATVGPEALALARAFWPGPLTLVLPKTALIPGIVTAQRPSVAVRMPDHALFRRLLVLAGRPLAAPSANPFGYVSPTTAAHVRDGLGRRIRHILDGGACRIGLESTIVDLRNPRRPVLLRPGAIPREALAAVLGRNVGRVPARRTGPPASAPASGSATSAPPAPGQVAPGLMARHYSPHTPVVLHTRVTAALLGRSTGRNEAWLLVRRPEAPAIRRRSPHVTWLDETGDLRRAGRRLFAALRELDAGGYAAIHAQLAPAADGLAEALNDRLRRAAARGR